MPRFRKSDLYVDHSLKITEVTLGSVSEDPIGHHFTLNLGEPSDNICLGYVQILEFPLLRVPGGSLADWMDEWSPEMGMIGQWLDTNAFVGGEYVTPDFGSVFYVEMLHIEPKYRGNGLGNQLMVHALKTVQRSEEDLATLVGCDQEFRGDYSKMDNRWLRDYYERCGLRYIGMCEKSPILVGKVFELNFPKTAKKKKAVTT